MVTEILDKYVKSLKECVQKQLYATSIQNNTNNRYIYIWIAFIDNEIVPIYVGRGKYRNKKKYGRAFEFHKISRDNSATFAQKKINKLKALGIPYGVYILFDELSLEQSNNIEKLLILKIGRRINNTGPLCNLSEGGETNPMDDPIIKEKHLKIMKSEKHSITQRMAYNNTPEIVNKRSDASRLRLKDPEIINKNRLIRNTNEYRNIQHEIQSKLTGKKVIINGIEYKSLHEASRLLGIDRHTLKNRLSNGNVFINYQKKKIEYIGTMFESKKELFTHLGISKRKLDNMIIKNPELFKMY